MDKLIWPPVVNPALLEREWTWSEFQEAIRVDVFDAPESLELIGGKIRFKHRKSPAYAACLGLIWEQVRAVASPICYWRTQMPLQLSERDGLDPALALVQGQPREHFKRHPRQALWVIEIADLGLDAQRQVRRPLYARNLVREHWLVDLQRRTIEVSSLPRPPRNLYLQDRIYTSNEQIFALAAPQTSISVADLLP